MELPGDFYPNVGRYLEEINRELTQAEQLRRELLREELRDVMRMMHEIYLLRVIKGVDEIARGRSPSPLLEDERHAFEEVSRILERLHTEFFAPAISGRAAIPAPREKTNVALIVSAEMPQIMGDDMRQYGPFKRGEVACLPRRCAELMIGRGLARKIEVSSPNLS